MAKNEENFADVEDGDGGLDAMANIPDFNVEDEYKPNPLIPKGVYSGVINGVKPNAAQGCIVWDICLQNNGGTLSDGETPLDGAHVYFRNWLPKPGDENTLTASGRFTKRQSKINMLKEFQSRMQINMNSAEAIREALQNHEWIGIEVKCEVDLQEYQGRISNQVNNLTRA